MVQVKIFMNWCRLIRLVRIWYGPDLVVLPDWLVPDSCWSGLGSINRIALVHGLVGLGSVYGPDKINVDSPKR